MLISCLKYFRLDFLITLSIDSVRNFGFILAQFRVTKSTSAAPGDEKVGPRKPLFYLRKTILFELGGRPGLPKSTSEPHRNSNRIFYRLLTSKRAQNQGKIGPKMPPGSHYKSIKHLMSKTTKHEPQMEPKSDPKGSRGAPKIPPKTGPISRPILGPILGAIWDHFGVILGPISS